MKRGHLPPLQLGCLISGPRRQFLQQMGTMASLATLPGVAMGAMTSRSAAALRQRVSGAVVTRADRDYADWCNGMVWQSRKPTRRPSLFVRALTETDVIEAVRFARRNGLKVGVRTNGYSVWATFMRNEGLLIDLSRFAGSSIDRASRTAVVQPALWGFNLIERAAPLGLAFPVGHCAQLGLGGYVMGGGVGVNHDHWNHMASFNVIGADVVTAAGELVTANATTNPDLYWAVRGAGQGFPGIVTKLHLQMHERPRDVRGSTYVLPLERCADSIAWIEQAMAQSPGPAEVLMVLAAGPDGQPKTIVLVTAYSATAEQSAATLAPFAASELARASLFKTEATESSMERVLIGSINPMTGFGFGRYAVDVMWTDDAAGALRVVAAQMKRVPSSKSHAVVAFKKHSKLPADTAFSRAGKAFAGLYAVWDERKDDPANLAWLREASRAMEPFASGFYINEIDVEAVPHKARDCFSPQAWQRLAQIRQQRDPQHLFHSFFGIA